MSEAAKWSDRAKALAEFDRAREAFVSSYAPVPPEALTYVPEGEDYTLGGLAVHVKQTLEHYARVVDQMKAAGYQPLDLVEPQEDAHESDMVRKGYGQAEAPGVVDRMRAAHDQLGSKIRGLPEQEYNRSTPVVYGAGQDPYVTRAADVMEWVIDHYNDHSKQVADLLAAWKAGRR